MKLKLIDFSELICLICKCLFLDKPIDRLMTSMDFVEIDEYTDNDNSENCKSTLFAHQLETRSNLNDDESNARYK